MSEPDEGKEQSEEIQRNLPLLQADYTEVNGSPFQHFFCPILFKDEVTDLCMGHIVSQKLPNSCRARVVQRKDVDGFFGKVVEPDFATLIEARSSTLKDVVFDPELSKKMRPRITVNGEELGHYRFRGHKIPPQHTGLILERKEGKELNLVLRKSRDEVLADLKKGWKIVVWLGVALAALMRVAEGRKVWLRGAALRRVLLECPDNDYRRFLLCECIEAYLTLDEEEKVKFEELLRTPPYQEMVPVMTTTFEKGILQGLQEGQRQSVRLLLEDRFGPLSPTAEQRLKDWPADRLGQLLLAVPKAESLKALGLEG